MNAFKIPYRATIATEVFGFDWDFDVLWEQVGKAEAVVKGRLAVRTPHGQVIRKTQSGGSKLKLLRVWIKEKLHEA